jgi:hypothetical protein
MDVLTITFVTASTALISAVTGPLVSYIVARRQIRASVISNNRERWIEALRDSVAEYVALLLSASMVKQTVGQDPKIVGTPSCARWSRRPTKLFSRTILRPLHESAAAPKR